MSVSKVLSNPDLIHSPLSSPEVLHQQVDRIIHSKTFRGSEVLRNLLSFLAACALEGRAESVKVREIATVVFGRSEDFDSQTDSVVRVHTGRLRSKLAEYYVDEGAEDEVILNVPKGSYGLSWHMRHHAPANPVGAVLPELEPLPPAIARSPARGRIRYILLTLALMTASVVLAVWISNSVQTGSTPQPSKPALKTFWRGFLAPNEIPLIVFSNFKLVGSFDSGMHAYHGDAADRGLPLIDTYTTIGEVMGVFDVSSTLGLFQQSARAKHGQLLSWDDAKDSNLIFVGGPLADTPLSDISAFRDFQFKKGLGIPAISGAIVNVHPRIGEQPMYVGPDSRPFQFDYAVISLRPAFSKSHRMLALAGITEYGTAGAAEFVSSEEQISDLLAKLNVKTGDSMPWFEALLRVRVKGSVPVQSEIVLVHRVR